MLLDYYGREKEEILGGFRAGPDRVEPAFRRTPTEVRKASMFQLPDADKPRNAPFVDTRAFIRSNLEALLPDCP